MAKLLSDHIMDQLAKHDREIAELKAQLEAYVRCEPQTVVSIQQTEPVILLNRTGHEDVLGSGFSGTDSCSICGKPVFLTPSGNCCENGHGF